MSEPRRPGRVGSSGARVACVCRALPRSWVCAPCRFGGFGVHACPFVGARCPGHRRGVSLSLVVLIDSTCHLARAERPRCATARRRTSRRRTDMHSQFSRRPGHALEPPSPTPSRRVSLTKLKHVRLQRSVSAICISKGALPACRGAHLLRCSRWLWPAGSWPSALAAVAMDGMPGIQPFVTLLCFEPQPLARRASKYK